MDFKFKNYKSLLLICIFFNMFHCKKDKQLVNQCGQLVIHDVRGSSIPKIDMSNHRAGEVEIYRGVNISEIYLFRYYQALRDSIQCHTSDYGTDEDFDLGQFQWLSDTSLRIVIKNSKSGSSLKFKLIGCDSRSSMLTE